MKYGVIICPKCHQVKSVLLSTKTTRCIRCNKIIYINKCKVFFKSNIQEEITATIGQINKEIAEKQ